MTPISRRTLLAAGTALCAVPGSVSAAPAKGSKPPLCVFSKHLADVPWTDLGRVARDLGYEGIDLTVRPKGHVLPENVERDLPKAVEAIDRQGLPVTMITTGLISPSDPAARPTLKTAASLKIPLCKLGYYRYDKRSPEAVIAEVTPQVRGLVRMAAQYGIAAGFHNHSGAYVGADIWDSRAIFEGLSPENIGYYFDPGHATIEGGLGGWQISLGLVLPRLKMVSLKDFAWEKKSGKWSAEWCPMGQGMVDWKSVFTRMAQSGFSGPLSMHVEYHAESEAKALGLAAEFTRKLIDQAWAASAS